MRLLAVVLALALGVACTPTLSGTVTDIDGKSVDLAQAYQGKVLVVVNVASECGYTPQYADLEQLYRKYKGKGVEVLAFPSNDFGGQEPGDRAAIKQFASTEYGATFPMFDKVHATGDQIAPLYKQLTEAQTLPEAERGPVKWNFEKFIVDRSGKIVARFRSKTEPMAPELTSTLDKLL